MMMMMMMMIESHTIEWFIIKMLSTLSVISHSLSSGPIRSGSTFLYVSYEPFSNAFAIHTICFGEPFDDFIESFYWMVYNQMLLYSYSLKTLNIVLMMMMMMIESHTIEWFIIKMLIYSLALSKHRISYWWWWLNHTLSNDLWSKCHLLSLSLSSLTLSHLSPTLSKLNKILKNIQVQRSSSSDTVCGS